MSTGGGADNENYIIVIGYEPNKDAKKAETLTFSENYKK